MTEVGAWTPFVVMTLTLMIFNVATIKLLQVAFAQVSFRAALREKDPKLLRWATAAVIPGPPPVGGVAGSGADVPDVTSFSRVAGTAGAIVLSSFLWALGNVVLYKAFSSADDISKILQGVQTFFLAGASLFAPYAFNQLRSAFAGGSS